MDKLTTVDVVNIIAEFARIIRLGLPQDTLLVAFAGRAIPEKGVRELVEAFSRLARPDAALVVAGDGPLLDELRAHKPARVFLEGAVPYAQTLQLLRQAHQQQPQHVVQALGGQERQQQREQHSVR